MNALIVFVDHQPINNPIHPGTSDGRFLSAAGAQVIELGPSYKTIHQVNEQVHISDLEVLCQIYENLLERLLCEEMDE
jgi:acetylornithine deacetylase/succinyl-diaminopimelate desuccinylase-like protein